MADNVTIKDGDGADKLAAADELGDGSYAPKVQILDGTAGGGFLVKLEDAAHASGDPGIQMLTVRKDTAAATAGTDGDYQPPITDASGRLHVNPGRSTTIDDAADVTLNNGSETSIVGSDSTRREAIITADPANTVNIRIGKTGQVGASRGALLQPGQSITLATTAAIYGYAAATSQVVSILLLKD